MITACKDIFYNHHIYPDGYRYHHRAIGRSLDGDSRLYSLSACLDRDGGDRQEVSGSVEDINILQVGLRCRAA